MSEEKQLTRHQIRKIAMKCLYQHLLLNKDIRKCVFEAMGTNTIDSYLYNLTMGTVENENKYINQISEHLRKDWSFDRLSHIEQAILLMAMQEIEVAKTPKAVVINEAITLAKKYGNDESYKMINGVLDQI